MTEHKEQRSWPNPDSFAIFSNELHDYLIESRLRHNGKRVLSEIALAMPVNRKAAFDEYKMQLAEWMSKNGMPRCRIAYSSRLEDVEVRLTFVSPY